MSRVHLVLTVEAPEGVTVDLTALRSAHSPLYSAIEGAGFFLTSVTSEGAPVAYRLGVENRLAEAEAVRARHARARTFADARSNDLAAQLAVVVVQRDRLFALFGRGAEALGCSVDELVRAIEGTS